MSTTLAIARRSVREAVNDLNPANYAIDSVRLARIVSRKAQLLGPRAGLGLSWEAAAFTMDIGSLADYPLAGSVQYGQILQMRVTGAPPPYNLYEIDLDEMHQRREWIGTDTGNGEPCAYSLIEGATQIVNVRLDTKPAHAYAVDVLRSTLPATTFTDATVVPFSSLLVEAVVAAAAADCVIGMSDEQLAIDVPQPYG